MKCPHFEDCWSFTNLTNVYWSYHRQNMLLVSHFDYWAFESSSNWAMLQWCRSDPLPFGRRKNPPTKIVTEISVYKFGGWKLSYETVSTTYTALYWISDNTSYSIRSALFTRVNPDRVTLCDAIRRADACSLLNINALSYFPYLYGIYTSSSYIPILETTLLFLIFDCFTPILQHVHSDRINGGLPLLPPPHLLFFANTLISRKLDIKAFTKKNLS